MEPQAPSTDLGQYLRARRGLVTAEQAGIADGPRRRVPGLRREEVALLAGISPDYYRRLERGRDTEPSLQVLRALARVLRLDEVETGYLIGLGEPRREPAAARPAAGIPSRLHHLLATIRIPAFVESRCFDVLAANRAATAFSPRIVPGENRLRSLLLDPEERAFHLGWDDAVRTHVASFRASIVDHSADPRTLELVEELLSASARFRSLWARHDVRAVTGGMAEVRHPVLGPLTVYREKLPVEDVILVVYYPASAGDGNEARFERLQLLAEDVASSGSR